MRPRLTRWNDGRLGSLWSTSCSCEPSRPARPLSVRTFRTCVRAGTTSLVYSTIDDNFAAAGGGLYADPSGPAGGADRGRGQAKPEGRHLRPRDPRLSCARAGGPRRSRAAGVTLTLVFELAPLRVAKESETLSIRRIVCDITAKPASRGSRIHYRSQLLLGSTSSPAFRPTTKSLAAPLRFAKNQSWPAPPRRKSVVPSSRMVAPGPVATSRTAPLAPPP